MKKEEEKDTSTEQELMQKSESKAEIRIEALQSDLGL